MIKYKLILTIIPILLMVIIAGACAEPIPSPTPLPSELAVKEAAGARDAAISYLQNNAGEDAPPLGQQWTEDNITPQGLLGGTTIVYQSDEWTVKVAYPIVLPENAVYSVTVISLGLGWHWSGQVNADGTITETGAFKKATEEESREIAEDFVKNSSTFAFDGIAETFKLINSMEVQDPYNWVFVFGFDSRQAGYGDRTGQMLAQVITPHEAAVTVQLLELKSAVMDDTWDMITQQEINNLPRPPMGVPAAPNDSIVTAKIIDVINVSGDFPWEMVIEIQGSEDVAGYLNATRQQIGEMITAKTQEDMSKFEKGQTIRANVRLEGDERIRFYIATSIINASSKPDNMIENITWILQSYGSDTNPKSVIEGTEITALFNSEKHQVAGSAGANSYFGGYQLVNYSMISIGQIGQTEMYRLDPPGVMDQEQEYLKILQNAESYKIEAEKLQINCGVNILVFHARQ
ncbi:META domain-containing protein [Chloroflexota bacterium]